MSSFEWVEVTHTKFLNTIIHMKKLPCSCHLYFYYGTHNVPEAKMCRKRTRYYLDSTVIQALE